MTCTSSPACFEEQLQRVKQLYRAKDSGATDAALLLLSTFPRESLQANVLDPIWKPLHKIISVQETLLGSGAGDTTGLEQACNNALRVLDIAYQRVCHKGNTHAGRIILYKIHVYSGDAHRYLGRSVPSCRKHTTYALQHYAGAVRMQPDYGIAYNQLALAHRQRGDCLLAAYFFLRSATALKEPFLRGVTSLSDLLCSTNATDLVLQNTLDQYEAACLAVLRAHLLDDRSADFDVLVERWSQATYAYVCDPSMCDTSARMVERFMISMYLVLIVRRVSHDTIDLLRRCVVALLTLVVQEATVLFDDGKQAVLAAAEVSLRCLLVSYPVITAIRALVSHIRTAAVAHKAKLGCCGAKPDSTHSLPEDIEFEGLGLLRDEQAGVVRSPKQLTSFWGPRSVVPSPSDARATRRARLTYLLSTIGSMSCSLSDEDDEVVFIPEGGAHS